MAELVSYVDVGIANEEDCQKALGIAVDVDVSGGAPDRNGWPAMAQAGFFAEGKLCTPVNGTPGVPFSRNIHIARLIGHI